MTRRLAADAHCNSSMFLSQTRLIEDLMGNDTVTLKLAWNVKRLSNSAAVSTDSLDSRKIPLPAYTSELEKYTAAGLYQ